MKKIVYLVMCEWRKHTDNVVNDVIGVCTTIENAIETIRQNWELDSQYGEFNNTCRMECTAQNDAEPIEVPTKGGGFNCTYLRCWEPTDESSDYEDSENRITYWIDKRTLF